ncbi:nucleotidyltransferase domain-containing protein [bacterium]|nr:MAG: nucleotidyltransferase domain-containing protein [bacterium]
MKFSNEIKDRLKRELKACLSPEKEVNKIILFGSFLTAKNPNDIDVAVFQDSDEPYLSLAMKYRKLTRKIAQVIPLDIIPIRSNAPHTEFLNEIESGELIYER